MQGKYPYPICRLSRNWHFAFFDWWPMMNARNHGGRSGNGGPDTLPLSHHRLYDGNDIDDAREALSGMFTEIALDPLESGQPFRVQVNGIELPRISVCYIRFENGAVAGPVEPLDFHTLQLNPMGSTVYNTDRDTIGGDAKQGVVLSAGQAVRNRHSEGNGNLALIVKDEVLLNYLGRYTGKEKKTSLEFAPALDLTQPRTASLLAFIDTFVGELNRSGGILEAPAAVASFEDTLLTSLLLGLKHNWSDSLEAPGSAPGLEHVCKLEAYIAEHASDSVDMVVLSEVSGLSGATIHRIFRKHRGYTPMQYLKEERMRILRRRLLLCDPSESVTRIAMECGFVHMGRLAAEYRRRFNENPSQTMKRTKPKAA